MPATYSFIATMSLALSAHVDAAALMTVDSSQTLSSQQTTCQVSEEQVRQRSLINDTKGANPVVNVSLSANQVVDSQENNHGLDTVRDLRAAVEGAGMDYSPLSLSLYLF